MTKSKTIKKPKFHPVASPGGDKPCNRCEECDTSFQKIYSNECAYAIEELSFEIEKLFIRHPNLSKNAFISYLLSKLSSQLSNL